VVAHEAGTQTCRFLAREGARGARIILITSLIVLYVYCRFIERDA
jgi:hypothetical protein